MRKVVQVSLKFCCAGIIIEEGIIVDSAPIFKDWIGMKETDMKSYYEKKNLLISWNYIE